MNVCEHCSEPITKQGSPALWRDGSVYAPTFCPSSPDSFHTPKSNDRLFYGVLLLAWLVAFVLVEVCR